MAVVVGLQVGVVAAHARDVLIAAEYLVEGECLTELEELVADAWCGVDRGGAEARCEVADIVDERAAVGGGEGLLGSLDGGTFDRVGGVFLGAGGEGGAAEDCEQREACTRWGTASR